jgi:hypothetical protein
MYGQKEFPFRMITTLKRLIVLLHYNKAQKKYLKLNASHRVSTNNFEQAVLHNSSKMIYGLFEVSKVLKIIKKTDFNDAF